MAPTANRTQFLSIAAAILSGISGSHGDGGAGTAGALQPTVQANGMFKVRPTAALKS